MLLVVLKSLLGCCCSVRTQYVYKLNEKHDHIHLFRFFYIYQESLPRSILSPLLLFHLHYSYRSPPRILRTLSSLTFHLWCLDATHHLYLQFTLILLQILHLHSHLTTCTPRRPHSIHPSSTLLPSSSSSLHSTPSQTST